MVYGGARWIVEPAGAKSGRESAKVKGWGYTKYKMAVAWRRARTPSLDSQRWRVLAINGQQYLIKALFDDQGYHVMISDLSTVWEEDSGAEKILRRGRVSGCFVW